MKREDNRRDGCSSNTRGCTLLYAMCVTLFSTVLFLYGFFPLKLSDDGLATMEDVPNHVEHVRINNALLHKPLVKKVIFMVIDGLRWDFVSGPIGRVAMPITRNLIENDEACLLRAKVDSPTVTMPRIKAITTGTTPTFVDVVLNFGSNSISGDSLLLQAKNHGHKLIFYGDDTWLKLFPNIFDRSDGTTSFFVTDYTEVDNNVTRHIDKELREKDWSIMVLHYLGLDHIGHIAGPQSSLVKPKLKEMDDIVGRIHASVAQWNSQGESTLFVICGDHGMRDSGGHGGSTPQETLVPFVVIGASCPRTDGEIIEMAQIDISSTLAIMLGIPIPASNLGSISLHILGELSTSRKLFSLYYNTKQVFSHFTKVTGYETTRAYEKYASAIKLHSAWLETNGAANETVDGIMYLYTDALKGMRDKLTNNTMKYDLRVMTAAMFFMYHVLYIILNMRQETGTSSGHILHFLVMNLIVWILVDYQWEGARESLLLSNDIHSALLLALIVVILLVNSYYCTRIKLTIEYLRESRGLGIVDSFLISGTLIHSLSLSSSSFVEEEHRTWYFFWTTLCVLLLYRILKSIDLRSPGYFHQSAYALISLELLLCLLVNVVLRQLNSTGDMYAHLPDIADWLQEENNKNCMTIVLISALSCLVWIGYSYEEIEYRRYALALYSCMATCIYLRHMVSGAVARVPFYPDSRGIREVNLFCCLILLFFAGAAIRLVRTIKTNRRKFLSLLLHFIVKSWVMASAMLHRPHNVGLLPLQILISSIIHVALRDYKNSNTVVHVHYWLGNVFYFYQGNSNNLSTIDVAAGYVGLESYNPYITGLFLIANTYSAPVLAYFTLLYGLTSKNKNMRSRNAVLEINRTYAVCRLLPLAVYTIVVSIQRYHLFVWTVFSPKLLYEAMYCAVMYFMMFTINIHSVLHDKINYY